MKQKTFRAPLRLKAEGEGEEGEFSAVFSTLNVIDLHGDVTMPGAFANGQPVIIEPWNHGWDGPPVGKGIIQADEREARVEGKFFLDTAGGLDHYRTVKNLGELAEWSYTFDVLKASTGTFDGRDVQFLHKLDVVGVGPVTRGAGIDTRTVGIKKKGDGEGEVEGGQETAADDKPRGASPQVIRVQIELAQLED